MQKKTQRAGDGSLSLGGAAKKDLDVEGADNATGLDVGPVSRDGASSVRCDLYNATATDRGLNSTWRSGSTSLRSCLTGFGGVAGVTLGLTSSIGSSDFTYCT